jgi:hypothetical protein
MIACYDLNSLKFFILEAPSYQPTKILTNFLTAKF